MELPEAFISRTKDLLGDEWINFEQALQEESPTSIRLNPNRVTAESLFLDAASKVSWANWAYYLTERPLFTLDPLFHAGCYYVQEASSMYLETLVRKHVKGEVKVLDLCAAPGGKATQLSSILSEKSLLVANEVIRSRANILAENLIKWGNPNCFVTNSDPALIGRLNGFFDLIVADLPCSGEGMFRKDPVSIAEWSPRHVQFCAERQRRIVADVWSALKSGGILIYSTCTYNRDENEENLDWICRELGAEIVENPRRFMPHQIRGEGFFIAALKKTDESLPVQSRKNKMNLAFSPRFNRSIEIKHWLKNPDEFDIFLNNNTLFAIPSILRDDYLLLKDRLKIIFAGITLGEMKGSDFVPNHALALSNRFSLSAFPQWELDKQSALSYLRKESLLNPPPQLPKGYLPVTYQKHPLGFVKNIGVRANNLYPQEWRIRLMSSQG